jgi:hypothetical protein
LIASFLRCRGRWQEHTKKFKDSNFNIVKEALDTVVAAAVTVTRPSGADRAAAALVVSVAVDKVSDRKLKDASCAVLTAVAEMLGPAFVARRVMRLLAAAKAPAQHTEGLTWLRTSVAEFGANAFPVQAVVSLGNAIISYALRGN